MTFEPTINEALDDPKPGDWWNDLLEAAKSVCEEWEQTGDVSVVRFAELRDAVTKAIGG